MMFIFYKYDKINQAECDYGLTSCSSTTLVHAFTWSAILTASSELSPSAQNMSNPTKAIFSSMLPNKKKFTSQV